MNSTPRAANGCNTCSRSFEKILLALKQGATGGHLHRSALPPDAILARETDAEEFHRIMNQQNAFKTMRDFDRLATTIHQNYLNNAKKNGWSVNPDVNKPYDELSPAYPSANLAAARRIPGLLTLISFRIVPQTTSGGTGWRKPLEEAIRHHRERLSQAEHRGWSVERMANGWTYHPKRDDTNKCHHLLVDWAALSEKDKDKDRENMDSIPLWLEMAGYKAEPITP